MNDLWQQLAPLEAAVADALERLGLALPARAVLAGMVVAAIVVLLLLWSWLRVRSANAKLPPKYRNRAGRRALARAGAAEKRGDKIAAAEAYKDAGLIDNAVMLYLAEKQVARACEVLIAAGRIRDAAQQYKLAGKWSQAGRLYKQLKDWSLAAEMFNQAEEKVEAAEAYEAAGEFAAAGERFLAMKDYARATRAFERAGDRARFLQAFVPWWEAELERQFGKLEPTSYWLPALDRAVDDAVAVEDWEAALKLGSYTGRWRVAAQAAEAMGRWADAKRFYQKLDDLEGVARTAEMLGESEVAYLARGEAAERAGNPREAAKFYELAGEAERALTQWSAAEAFEEVARVAEGLGRLEQAAAAWLRAGQPHKAAPLFEHLERWGDAGTAWVHAEEFKRAAEAFRKAERYVDAADASERRGDTQAAIRDLQRQLRVHGQSRAVSLKLVDLMMAEGMRGAALGVLEPYVRMQPSSEEDADVLYRFAMLLEGEGKVAEAAKAYDRILAYDLAFRDANERAQRLKTLMQTGSSDPLASLLGGSQPSQPGPGHSQASQTIHPGQPVYSHQPGYGSLAAPAGASPRLGSLSDGDTRKIYERYVPQGELGRGGMGIVVKAHDKVLDRMVALKLVQTPGMEGERLDRLLSEARATAKLNHPNIVQIYDCALAQGHLLMAMEFVEGITVKQLIEREGPLPVAALALIFGQVAKALAYAHAQGIVHRDIKPANILWTADKQVKITDFGLARAAQELANTQTVVVGSPYYMAPEQLMGERMDHRVDLYALGVSMFEAATGALPFPKGDVGYHHIHTPAPDPRAWREDLPAVLAQLIMDLMAKAPKDRPRDADEVIARFKAALKSRE